MRILLNAVSAKMGGAVRHLAPFRAALRAAFPDDTFLLAKPWEAGDPTYGAPLPTHPQTAFQRLKWDQYGVNVAAEGLRCDAILSLLNFGPVRHRVPHIVCERNPQYFHPAYRHRPSLRRWLVRQVMRGADRVIVPSAAMANWILDAFPEFERTTKLRVVHHGVDHSVFHPALARYGNGDRREGTPIILGVGPRDPWRDLGTLEAACKDLPAILMVAENVPQDHMPDLYRVATIFVFPSFCESFGFPLVEAMASGLPVVAADSALNREICGNAAVFFPVGDWATLRQQLKHLIRDTALQKDLEERSLKRSMDFSWTKCVSEVVAVVKEAIR